MQLLSLLSTLSLLFTNVNGYYNDFAVRSADLDSYEVLHGREADTDDMLDMWERDYEVRDTYPLDDYDHDFSLLVRELASLHIRNLESSLLEDRDIYNYHYARASGGRSPSPPRGGGGRSPSPGPSGGSSGDLAFPSNVQPDGKQLYAWKRVYVEMKQYTKKDGLGINHALLMRNTVEHGGHHSSLVVGDGHNFMETDLQFDDSGWIKTTPSGKGYPASAMKLPWVSDAKMDPKLKMGRSTHQYLGPLNKAETLSSVYNKGMLSLIVLECLNYIHITYGEHFKRIEKL
ncbi:hypothetical protein MMC10_003902 [Thelotrema lepadinum]|nr:hypothetical protein [Thelotrema lepadinum]